MEPLCSNNIVFFGPHIENNPEALESLEQQLTFKVHSTNDIVQFMETFIGKSHAELKTQIKNFTEAHRGASQRTTQEILTRLF
jgi:3-deoxy-D-manno-octulosonic-acid transferase